MPSFAYPPDAGGGGGGAATPIGAHVRRSNAQAFVSGLQAPISFDTVLYDQGGCFNALNPTRLTAPVAGKYLIIGNFNWVANAVSLRRGVIQLNGVSDVALDDKDAVTSGVGTTNLVVTELDMAAGDFVELDAQQFSGGPLNVEGGVAYSPNFSIRKVA
jgi:hypothetical protein